MNNRDMFNIKMMIGIFIAVLAIQPLFAAEKKMDSVVAVMDGENITYKDIAYHRKYAEYFYGKKLEPSQLEQLIKQEEMKALLRKIRNYAFDYKVKSLGITVSEQDVDKRVDKIWQGITTDMANKILNDSKLTYAALLEWQKNTSESESIYNKYLSSFMGMEQWELYKISYETPEQLSKFYVPKDIDDIKRMSRESSRKDLLYEKLRNIVAGDITTPDKDYMAKKIEYDKSIGIEITPARKIEIRQEAIEKNKDKAMEEMWLQTYEEMGLKIINDNFTGALKGGDLRRYE